MLTLSNDLLELRLDPRRGAEITSMVPAHNPTNVLAFYDWNSPIPADGLTNYGDPELDWLSRYRGGWQETAPNAGQASDLDGMPLPFHGEASFVPWAVVEQNQTSCVLETHLRPTLLIRRSMALFHDRAGVEVATTVINTGLRDVPLVWGHHPAFICDDRTVLHLPAGPYAVEVSQQDSLSTSSGSWPYAQAEDGTDVDLCRLGSSAGSRLVYRHGHSEGWAVIEQANDKPHIAMAWDIKAYPAIWVWQNRSHPGFPWFGRMRSLAVEPQRAWPLDGLAGARRRGQELVVAPGAEVSSWIVMAFPESLPNHVSGVSRAGTVT
jgi:galactose mutarotase-like enzyme